MTNNNNKISVNQLFTAPNRFELSKCIEQQLTNLVLKAYGSNQTIHQISEGYDPTFDVQLVNQLLLEIKISKNPLLSIEYQTYDGHPSGIHLSKAKYYIMLNPGYSKNPDDTFNFVGKIRAIRTSLLKELVEWGITQNDPEIHKIYQPNDQGPGSKCVLINAKKVLKFNDGWIGWDVAAFKEGNDVIFDLDQLKYIHTRTNKDFM